MNLLHRILLAEDNVVNQRPKPIGVDALVAALMQVQPQHAR